MTMQNIGDLTDEQKAEVLSQYRAVEEKAQALQETTGKLHAFVDGLGLRGKFGPNGLADALNDRARSGVYWAHMAVTEAERELS